MGISRSVKRAAVGGDVAGHACKRHLAADVGMSENYTFILLPTVMQSHGPARSDRVVGT